nr:BadF/BadG/BcrA/BcrD ATPase family protein [uncultured Rhizobium sp.]
MRHADSTVVLGVDGGGTKTIAVLSDLTGQVLGYGRGGSCDIYSHSGAADEVALAVERACTKAGIGKGEITSAVYSLAGADWPEDFVYWHQAINERGFGADIQILNDAVGVLNSDLPEGNAVVVVCGTGAAIGSRNVNGAIWHSSFWQLTQGGGEISDNVLRAVYRDALGIDPPTSLTPSVLRYYKTKNVEDLLHMFTGRERERVEHRASLVPILCTEAEEGDAASRGILERHGAALADFALVAARKVDIADKPFHLLLTGGVFRNPSQIMRQALVERMRQQGAQFSVLEGRSEPVKGAVMTALRMQSGHVTAEVSARLDSTFPPQCFFQTARREECP